MLISIILISLFVSVHCYAPDQILALPGLEKQPSFRQYSGYLNATENNFFHYWFFESQNQPSQDPVVLWLTGGPGCSSGWAALTENGPFRVKPNGQIAENPYSWNLNANVLYIESPATVGFSYHTDNSTVFNDDLTAEMNLAALISFFVKFPQFKSNQFFMTGESYGGIYLPTLAVKILDSELAPNFKAMAIGNGCVDMKSLALSRLEFLRFHGYIEGGEYRTLLDECCNGTSFDSICDMSTPKTDECTALVKKVVYRFAKALVNPYNVVDKCVNNPNVDVNQIINSMTNLLLPMQMRKPGADSVSACTYDSGSPIYFNRRDVRKALHIPDHVQRWEECSQFISDHYKNTKVTTQPEVEKVLSSGRRVLIYNGDVDIVCDFISSQRFVERLNMKETGPYQNWNVDGQVAGFARRYENLTFTTIRGAGHMVPGDKPKVASEMLKHFLKGEL